MLSPSESSALGSTDEGDRHETNPTTASRRPLPRARLVHPQRLQPTIVVALTRLGISVRGSRELRVRGRKSGEWRTDAGQPAGRSTAQRYLVAPRGRHPVGAQPPRSRGPASCGSAAGSRRSARPRSPTTTRSPSCAPTCAAGRWKSACSSTASAPTPPTRSCARSPTHPVFRIVDRPRDQKRTCRASARRPSRRPTT